MYAIQRTDNHKLLAKGNRWVSADEFAVMVWYEFDLCRHYQQHAVPKRIDTQIIAV